ncbi:uncharacterized protein LOC144437286 [Glandiceps talaboti]
MIVRTMVYALVWQIPVQSTLVNALDVLLGSIVRHSLMLAQITSVKMEQLAKQDRVLIMSVHVQDVTLDSIALPCWIHVKITFVRMEVHVWQFLDLAQSIPVNAKAVTLEITVKLYKIHAKVVFVRMVLYVYQ